MAHQAPDLLALWQAWEAESGARHDVPFWALVWPAAQAGAARVIAHDRDPVALAIAAKNATANAVALTLERTPLLYEPCPMGTQCILVGDLFYERAAAAGLEAWLRMAHGRGVQVLIADASRPFAPTAGVRCLREARLATAWHVEGTLERMVRLLTLDA